MIHMEQNDMALYPNKESDLEHNIRELINKVTNSTYVSALNVKEENGIYTLRLGLNCKDAAPIVFGYQGSEVDFLKFLEKEFLKRKLQNTTYTTGTLVNGDSNLYYPIIEL